MYHIFRWIPGFEIDDPGHWQFWAKRQTKRATVRQVRELEAMGYDRSCSIYVERRER